MGCWGVCLKSREINVCLNANYIRKYVSTSCNIYIVRAAKFHYLMLASFQPPLDSSTNPDIYCSTEHDPDKRMSGVLLDPGRLSNIQEGGESANPGSRRKKLGHSNGEGRGSWGVTARLIRLIGIGMHLAPKDIYPRIYCFNSMQLAQSPVPNTTGVAYLAQQLAKLAYCPAIPQAEFAAAAFACQPRHVICWVGLGGSETVRNFCEVLAEIVASYFVIFGSHTNRCSIVVIRDHLEKTPLLAWLLSRSVCFAQVMGGPQTAGDICHFYAIQQYSPSPIYDQRTPGDVGPPAVHRSVGTVR
ncbi:hypothetical protein VP01_1828g4 [Puccinia sorghi]|uniref:Uncharacterized protein n=1 Tax=Puccinia sorghi TaxID=27349 RepID=A0A0L6VDU7_9BASI|nr:hypothetical protein VP01_1828g4 [Puccinia sorghi]